MVGVSGPNPGCLTCRKDRITCGKERPRCRKCERAGRECGGYDRFGMFITAGMGDKGRCSSHPRRTLHPQANAQKKSSQSAGVVLHLPSYPQPVETQQSQSTGVVQHIPSYTHPLVRIPEAFLNRVQCLALHTNILSLEAVHESTAAGSNLPPLMSCLPELTQGSPALEHALRALYLIHMGVNRKDDALIKQSAVVNANAMARVRVALVNTRTAARMETVAAAICLYLYEQVACTAEKTRAWRILFHGASLLVQRRGPAAYRDFPDHHFFVRLFRNDAVFDAMSRRKATFLADPEWCSVPWEKVPKSDMDRLFDLQVLLPGIFEREEQLEKLAPSPARRQQARELLEYCTEVDQKFEDWYRELHARSPKPLFWSIPGQVHVAEATVNKLGFDMCSHFSTYFQFVDLNTAFLHSYYWAALGLFYRKMQHIHRFSTEEVRQRSSRSPDTWTTVSEATPQPSAPPPETPSFQLTTTGTNTTIAAAAAAAIPTTPSSLHPHTAHNSPFPFPTTPSPPTSESASRRGSSTSSLLHSPAAPLDLKYSESSTLALAYLICQSIPFHLNRTLRALGPDHSAWPLWTALQVFKRRGYSEEMAWCRKMMEMWDREGWGFARNMERMEWRE